MTLKAGLRSCINNVKRLSCNNNLICQTLKFQNDPTWCYVRWHSWWPSSNSWRVVIFSKGLWQRDEHRQKEANTKKNGTLLFVTVFWARDKVRNTPALVRFTTRNRTAPPRPPYHSPSENQYSAKVLVKRLWVGTLSRVIKVYQECI